MRLLLKDISVTFGDKEVLRNINFEINTKDKIAIIGRNGCGKSTLLKVITGEQEIDFSHNTSSKDKIVRSGNFEVGYLRQIAFDDDNETFENEILKVFKDITDLKARIDNLERLMSEGRSHKDIAKYEELLNTYDRMGGYTYLKEYNLAIKKFGFVDSDKTKPLKEFSGGQRTKIALIKLLLGKPDLLILDEPTNHLDITTIKWLEEYLANYSKAILVVSHDRAFLDKFVNIVYEIERHEIKKYVGNYSDFVKVKAENYDKEMKEYEAYVKEKDRLLALADRFRYKATKASMAQSKLKQIERMGEMDRPMEADSKVFASNMKPRIESGNDVLMVENIEIGYNKPLAKISFKIIKGDRIGVVGGNGLGKSTLLKSLVGKIPLISGKVKFGTNVEVGYFDQQTATNNISNESILDNFIKEFPEESTQSARTILGSFMFTKDDVFKNLTELSGGELVRLELCKILRRKPNFLILDEPTNHMDIMGKEALERMLQVFEGTIIFVSHDRYFVNKIATSLVVFEEDGCKYLRDTTYSDYERISSIITQGNTIKTATKEIVKEPKEEKKTTNLYLLNKEKTKKEARRKKLEKEIALLESQINELTEQMSLPSICSDYVKIMEIQKVVDDKNVLLETLMEEWYTLIE